MALAQQMRIVATLVLGSTPHVAGVNICVAAAVGSRNYALALLPVFEALRASRDESFTLAPSEYASPARCRRRLI